MVYLLGVFWLWLLPVLLCGIVIGWMTSGPSRRPWHVGWVRYGVALYLLALAGAVLQGLAGRAGLWLETGLLFVTVYGAGCLLGAFAWRLAREEPPLPAASADVPVPAPAAAHDDRADDLKVVRGIGPQIEARLNALGIRRLEQIAAWSAEEARGIGTQLGFPGRVEREAWVAQARERTGLSAPQAADNVAPLRPRRVRPKG